MGSFHKLLLSLPLKVRRKFLSSSKVQNHDMLTNVFLQAADANLLPRENIQFIEKPVITNRGIVFPHHIGLSDGISMSGKGVEGLLDSFGLTSSGEKGSVQVGPCCPDRRAPQKTYQASLVIDIVKQDVKNENKYLPSITQVAANLLDR